MDLLNLSGYMSLCKKKLWSYSFQQVSKNTKFEKNFCGLGKQKHTLLSDTTELLTTSIALKLKMARDMQRESKIHFLVS